MKSIVRHFYTQWLEKLFILLKTHTVFLKILNLWIFFALIFLPLFLPEPPLNASPLNNFTVFSNFLIWTLWFPLVLLSVILVGRSWCGFFCPQGATSEWVNHYGLQKEIPSWIRWEGTPIVSFLLITILGQTLGVRDHPEAAAGLFGGTMLIAIVIGFLYGKNKRVWCRHLCPIGLLLGIFSRLGVLHFACSKELQSTVGEQCTEKGACPMMIDLRFKKESRHCIACQTCVKKSSKAAGMIMKIRSPGEEVSTIHHYSPNIYETIFLFLGTGIALSGFLWIVLPFFQEYRHTFGEWLFSYEWYWAGEPGPNWLMSVHPQRGESFTWIDFFSITSFMLGFMFLLAFVLFATTTLSAWLAIKLKARRSLLQSFVELSYQYVPIAMVSLILGLGSELFHVFTWLGFTPQGISIIKFLLFSLAFFWSILLGNQILAWQQVGIKVRWLPLIPSIVGSASIGLAWNYALF
ncbi:4Fe-4S binding protein [Candidatus Parabeggiatoa sp. HSG14]|uniref:4Fe-4S binding protein n=1 Tax=Candidatus Parabeggiatoa sp. HSG14 TaxID=3055593 RepID=UPI0025A7CAA4|nr:4Fe-4S binding protein [Thiotrichales bacterium HSG14]